MKSTVENKLIIRDHYGLIFTIEGKERGLA